MRFTHLAFCLTLIFLIRPDALQGQSKSYSIPEIRTSVDITEDGLVQINEERTYIFSGSYSWADYRLPLRGFSEIRNIRVSEDDRSYINENNEQPGTFSVSREENSVVVRWNYNAEDTTRIFNISYELTDAMVIGPEWSEFFWNYIASGREKATDLLEIDLNLPQAVPSDSIHIWTRGPDEKISVTERTGGYRARAIDLSRNQSFRIRMLFPTRLLNRQMVDITDPSLTLESVTQSEEERMVQIQEERERDAFYRALTDEAVVLIGILSIGIFILIYRKYGTRHSTGTISDRETVMIPDDLPPAVIGRFLSSGMSTGHHVVATIFDLARRGYYKIEEEENTEKGFFSTQDSFFFIEIAEERPDADLTDWEMMVLDFVDHQVEQGNQRFDKLFSDSGSDFTEFFNDWKKKIKEIYDAKNWIDKESYKGLWINIPLQLLLLAVAFFFLIVGDTAIAFIGLFITVIMMMASFAIIRRTPEGEAVYTRWTAYKKGLKNADERTIRMEMLDRHFIYAVAFQLSTSKIKTLIEQGDDNFAAMFPWIVLMSGSSSSPASIASSIGALASTGTATATSVGGGAGASAGAAGGGAGGGAG